MKLSELLARHREGLDDAELTELLQDLAGECARHDKGGTLTITIGMVPVGDGVGIRIAHKLKAPEDAAPAKTYFLGLDGELTRRHPSQPSLPGVGVDE